MTISYRELKSKQVIGSSGGALLGSITDLEICTEDSRIASVSVQRRTGLFGKSETYVIPWEKIEKIGSDVILVGTPGEVCGCDTGCSEPKPGFRRFFSK